MKFYKSANHHTAPKLTVTEYFLPWWLYWVWYWSRIFLLVILLIAGTSNTINPLRLNVKAVSHLGSISFRRIMLHGMSGKPCPMTFPQVTLIATAPSFLPYPNNKTKSTKSDNKIWVLSIEVVRPYFDHPKLPITRNPTILFVVSVIALTHFYHE